MQLAGVLDPGHRRDDVFGPESHGELGRLVVVVQVLRSWCGPLRFVGSLTEDLELDCVALMPPVRLRIV